MQVNLIVAMSENRVIGRNGQLPWHLSPDLKRVKALTMGYPIILGRKNHESIGRLLPGRTTVILSRNPQYKVPGALVFQRLDEALPHLRSQFDQAFIFGGEQIYRLALPIVDRIYLTLIHQHVEGDTYFPTLPEDSFAETERQFHGEPRPFSWITLERK